MDFDGKLRKLAEDMLETMCDAPGVGLAAPQVGIGLRFFVFDDGETGPMAMANPVLSAAEGESVEDEGCLSIPGPFQPTPRSATITCRGQGLDGAPLEMTGEGLLARIFQHETDHLDGTLFIDRLDEEGRRAVLAEMRRIELGLEEPRERRRGLRRRDPAALRSDPPYPRGMTAPRVVFLGNDPWSVPSLKALAERGPSPVLVLTRTPRPAGRGSKLRPTEVARFAAHAGLPLLEVDTVREGVGWEALREARPDVVAVVAYGEILTRDVLQLPAAGCLNLHFSLLPRWRGAAPVQRAIMEGDAVTGVSVMVMDEGLDTGAVLRAQEVEIEPGEDAGSLGARLAALGAQALRDAIPAFASGQLVATPQPDAGVTLAAKVGAEERRIDWRADADVVARLVRALSPSPGASTRFRDTGLKVLRGRPDPEPSAPGEPGTILGDDATGVQVAAGSGAYRVEEVAPAGRRRMPAAAWARGARFAAGERLG